METQFAQKKLSPFVFFFITFLIFTENAYFCKQKNNNKPTTP